MHTNNLTQYPSILLFTILPLGACGRVSDYAENPIEYSVILNAIESMNGTELTGTVLRNFKILNSAIVSHAGSGLICSPASCNGIVFADSLGTSLKIVDVSTTGLYSVQFLSDETWQPICRNRRLAIPISGSWGARDARLPSTSAFTFVCQESAAFKCKYKFNYDPAKDEFQACTRMLRADYCGFGPNTREGELIDVADANGVTWTHRGSSWPMEAAWGTGGAVCLDANRFNHSDLFCKERLGRCDDLPWGGTPGVLLKTLVKISSGRGLGPPCAPGYDYHCGDVCRPLMDACP